MNYGLPPKVPASGFSSGPKLIERINAIDQMGAEDLSKLGRNDYLEQEMYKYDAYRNMPQQPLHNVPSSVRA
jgi:hypothetical protein